MNKVLALLVASVLLLLRFSPSAAQMLVETDSSSREGETLTSKIDIDGVDISAEINVTALTFAAFKEKYPGREIPAACQAQGADEAEENDFSGGTIALDLLSAIMISNHLITVEFNITEDDVDELEEIFLVILEIGGELVLNMGCSIGRIRADPNDAISLQLKETNFNVMEGARNKSLTIIRNGASELEREVGVVAVQCSEGQERARGEDVVIPKTIKLPPTNETISELPLPIQILGDDIPEPDECVSIQLTSNLIAVEGITDIIIEDDDLLRVGWNFTQPNGFQVEEGRSIEVCAAILEPQGDISMSLFIGLDIELLFSSTSDENKENEKFKLLHASTENNRPKLTLLLYSEVRADCITVKAIDDEDLEKDLTFGIKLSGVGLPQATIEFDPDTVMVTITDNDGTPNRPEVTEVKLVDDDKDLLITWDIEEDELRPVDNYTGTVTLTEKVNERRRQTVNIAREPIVFESEDKEERIQGIDADKIYEIQICARNRFGSNCSEPFTFPAILPTRRLPTRPEPILPEESGGLATGAIIAIVVVLLLLFLCCLLLLLFLLCFCQRERSKKYYPQKNEEKYAEEYERYREQHSRSSSIDSELKYEFELEQVPI